MDDAGLTVPPSWRRTVDRSVMACGTFVLSVQLVVCLAALARLVRDGDTRSGSAVLVVVAADLVLVGISSCGVVWPERVRTTPTTWLAATVALAGVVAAASIGADAAGPALAIVSVNAAQAAQAVALGLILWPWSAVGFILGTGALYVPLRVAVAGADVLAALDEWILPAGTSLGVLAVLHQLRRRADVVDRLVGAADEEAQARTELANRELARDEARRLIHDEVISALRAIELRVGSGRERVAAAGALRALRGTTRLSSLSAVEDGWRNASRLEVDVESTRWRLPPPPRVLAALAGAVGEALRNAELHGAAGRAVVELSSDEHVTAAEIRDDGRGLRVGWRPGFGVSESIVGRMRAVGGSAVVGPAAGGGAVVRIRWPEDVSTVRATAGELALAPRAVLWPLAAASALSTVYLCVRFPGASPMLSRLVALALVVVLVLVVGWLGRLRAAAATVSVPAALVIGTTVCALTWVGLVAAGDGALVSVRSWVVGSAANVVALLAFEARARLVVPIVVAQVLLVLIVAALDPTVTVTEPIGSVATPVVVGGLGLVLGGALRHGERRARLARARLTRSREAAAWSTSDVESRHLHLAHLEDDVVPYLRHVAAGRDVDPLEATLLSLRCRDALYLDRPLDAETRAVIQAARRSGSTVTIRPGDHRSRTAWPLLRRVLAVAAPGSRITVLPSDRSSGARTGAGRIVVVPAVPTGMRDRPDDTGVHDAVRSTFDVPERGSPERSTDADGAHGIEMGHGADPGRDGRQPRDRP